MVPALTRMMNGAFVIFVLGPIIPVFWAFCSANEDYIAGKAVLKPVITSLLQMAPTFSPGTYNKLQLMAILIPALQCSPHIDSIMHHARMGLVTYLAVAAILCLLYIPVLLLTFLGLSDRTAVGKPSIHRRSHYDCEEAIKSLQLFEILRKQQRTIALQASLVYAITLSYIPVLIWLLTFSGQKPLFSSSWWAILEIGLQGPMAIMGNVCLFRLHHIKATPSPNNPQEESWEVCFSGAKLVNVEGQSSVYLS
eukprot:GHVR01162149.1.p1 GENE.GHVR01162149.1~~GHVR01162149.1.p1  ORF type:complete len:252 (-),score=-4.28 GHVR01162149.1:43-798(-)